MYESPAGDFEFGDVFSAAWMFDVHVRGDARALKPFDCHMGKGKDPVRGYQAAVGTATRELVLAHGRSKPAVLLSDNCEIESVIVRRSNGRLTFAAIEPWPADSGEAEQLLEATGFRRHPLPPDEDFEGGVANLENLFAVGRDALVGLAGDPRVARLDGDAVIDLEIRWNAFAARRGPRSHFDNASKLAMLLTADGDADLLTELQKGVAGGPTPEALDVAAAKLLAETLTVAWHIEGGVLNTMADAVEHGDRPDPTRDEILQHLHELRDLADKAHRALAATRRPAS